MKSQMGFVLTNGLLGGMILAAFLALCDGLFHTTTFDVLIDVSYVPMLTGLPSLVELLIHLLVSVVVMFVIMYFYPLHNWMVPRYLAKWVGIFFVMYFPFGYLSKQPLSLSACLIWLLGHAVYTLFVAYQIERHG